MPDPDPVTSIPIGTLVRGEHDAAAAIERLIPLGFESVSIFFWEQVDLDLAVLADEVRAVTADHDVRIDCIGVYGNPLEDEAAARSWTELIDLADRFGASVVAGFAGRVRDRPVDGSIPRFAEVFAPLATRAADRGVRIAFENCDMGGTWAHGDWNIAHSPAAWELMFDAVPAPNVGLEWDPSHTIGALQDPIAQLREWVDRVFHVHGKDATVHRDVIGRHGIHGGRPIATHRFPGFGDLDWRAVFDTLRSHGYRGCVDIEGWHDPVFSGELEMTGQVEALRYLRRCRGGSFVPSQDGRDR